MTKNTANSEVVMLKRLVRTKFIVAIGLGAALLPLSTIAAPVDDKEAEKLSNEIIRADQIEKVNTISNENGILQVSELSGNDDSLLTSSTRTADNVVDEPSDANTLDENSNSNIDATEVNNAASTTAALDSVNERGSANTQEKIIETPSKAAEQISFWKNTDYLLNGGLLLLLLGGALLSFLKISRLNDENQDLRINIKELSQKSSDIRKQLQEAKNKNMQLEASLAQQSIKDYEPHSSNFDSTNEIIDLTDEQVIAPVIEDLDSSDLQQLSDSITSWFKKNRGQTQVRELVPNHIQSKLDHLNYKIELWVGSDGVDSIEIAENTMRAAIISLTKPDRQGFAYCYKKPNSLSTVWINKAWYQTQRTDHTLEIKGKPLEIN